MIDRITAKICLHRPWPPRRVFWLEWFLNGNLACLNAFTGSDTAARKNGSVYLFDINIPFLQAAFGGAEFFFSFSLKYSALFFFFFFCVCFVFYYLQFQFRLATQGSSAMGI